MSYLPMILFQENYINASIYLRKKNIYALRKKKKKQQVEDMQIIKDILSNGHGTCNSFSYLHVCYIHLAIKKKSMFSYLTVMV